MLNGEIFYKTENTGLAMGESLIQIHDFHQTLWDSHPLSSQAT